MPYVRMRPRPLDGAGTRGYNGCHMPTPPRAVDGVGSRLFVQPPEVMPTMSSSRSLHVAFALTLGWMLLSLVVVSTQAAGIAPATLRCEYAADPLGIDGARPRLSWVVQAADAGGRGQKQTAYQILVADAPASLEQDKGNCWDTGKVDSDQTVQVEYAGKPLQPRGQYWWKVRAWDKAGEASPWSKPARFGVGPMGKDDWRAKWISSPAAPAAAADPAKTPPLPWLRKTFTLQCKPERATAYVTAMGYFELYVNGKKVNDDVLGPAVSDFSKRSLYLTYDIGKYLVEGKNCVALWLGRGWYFKGIPGVIHDSPMAMAEFDITAADGQAMVIGTDASWKSHPSSITPQVRGEIYEQKSDLPGWNIAELDDSAWTPAKVFEPKIGVVAAQVVEPNRIQKVIEPLSVKQLAPGVHMIDMGRFLSGWLELGIDANAGQKVVCEYGENIDANGKMNVYEKTDEYVLNQDGPVTLRTRFEYHAFRWVRVTGLTAAPELKRIRGHMITTDMARAGRFECSNDLLNRIYETVMWTHRCLTLGGYSVDCPHRERLGYGGDCHATMESILNNFDAGAFYTKWLRDWWAAQDAEGNLPHVSPAFTPAGGGPAWSGVCVTLPWEVYLRYGDRRILEQSYPTIQKWLAFLDTKCKNNILEPYGDATWGFLGDWVPPGRGQGPKERIDARSTHFFNNCYRLNNVQLAAKIADILGKKDDAAAYRAKADVIRKAVHERFFDPKRETYVNGQQPYLALALLTNVAPESLRAKITKDLADDILVKHKGHLDSGIHGTYYLIEALNQVNRPDLVYSITSQTTYPGWGHMLANGATTIWEEWGGANSHCHSSFLAIGAWFIEQLGGIQCDEAAPGFQHIVLRPAVVRDLSFVRAAYDSIHGPIQSDWTIKDNTFDWTIDVPANTTATAYVPATDAKTVREGDVPAAEAPGVKFLRMEGDRAVFAVESGRYRFRSTLP